MSDLAPLRAPVAPPASGRGPFLRGALCGLLVGFTLGASVSGVFGRPLAGAMRRVGQRLFAEEMQEPHFELLG